MLKYCMTQQLGEKLSILATIHQMHANLEVVRGAQGHAFESPSSQISPGDSHLGGLSYQCALPTITKTYLSTVRDDRHTERFRAKRPDL